MPTGISFAPRGTYVLHLNYEQIQNAINGIDQGEHRIQRLTREGEAGRIAGGRLLIGSSLVIGGSNRAITESDPRKRRNQEEELQETDAKELSAWVDCFDTFKRTFIPPTGGWRSRRQFP